MKWTATIGLTLGAALAATGALAQDYPTDRITFIVGFDAGGYADGVGRIVAEHVGNALGQTVVVDNRPGAASNVAARAVASAEPDGYTVLVTTTAIAINTKMYATLDYSLADDLIAVAVPIAAPEMLAVNPSKPHTLEEFLAAAKEQPMSFSSAGTGSGSFLAISSFFNNEADVDIPHVPFQGGAPALQAAVGDQVDAVAATASGTTIGQVKEGNLVCLGIAADERFENIPDCPTFAESGFEGFEAASWVGFFVPAGTDPAIVETLNEAINSIADSPETLARMTANGMFTARSVEDTATFVDQEVELWGARVEAAGVQIE